MIPDLLALGQAVILKKRFPGLELNVEIFDDQVPVRLLYANTKNGGKYYLAAWLDQGKKRLT